MKKTLILAVVTLGAIALTSTARADGASTYADNCAKCHGADGKGDTKMGQKLGVKDFTDAKVQADMKDDTAFKAIKEGLKSPEDKTLMKPFDALSDEDIKAVVAYVRTLKK
jgi:mono/diheme cytochrome c family protein